jgi:hypothetical protein
MTVGDLIDYLTQFPPETKVVLLSDDAPSGDTGYIVLEVLDYSPTPTGP